MLIDVHTHIFPDAIADRAVGKLAAGVHKKPYTSGTLSHTLQKVSEWGVDEIWLQSIATNERQMKNVNDFALSASSDKVFPFGSVYPLSSGALEELERIYSLGIRAVKLHPEYQTFEVFDERVFPVYDFLEKHCMLTLLHAGKDSAYPDTYNASPKSLAKLRAEFPNLKMIAAHMGGWSVWDEVYNETAGKDIYFDTAYLSGMLDPSLARKIVLKHGAERLLFGSDCPWSSATKELEFIKSLGIRGNDLDLVTYKNAQSLKAFAFRG